MRTHLLVFLSLSALLASLESHADSNTLWQSPQTCDEMTLWDPDTGMCVPYAMPAMEPGSMTMAMLHGNAFGTRIWQTGPRGRDAWASPSMVMGDIGSNISTRHYLNLDVMMTAEKWAFPDRGYPLFLQIGESNQQGVPFIDAQHPHSSPIMGLTLSDTITLGEGKDYLKLFFAPRGEATDGPIAFMHRITGIVNPDAPLGHHIGQDVGHISSTVIGASLKMGRTWFEASTYHGAEPEPENIDLPIGKPDSVSLRLIHDFTPKFTGMISAARINAPEPDLPEIAFENRYSASIYCSYPISSGWTEYHTLIYGLVTQYDHASALSSFTKEFLLMGDRPRIWGRFELLQRTPAELEIQTSSDPNSGKWVGAVTLGYTHRLLNWESAELGLGGSATKDFLPGDYIGAYGGNPWTGKVFLQLGGMHMWDLR